MIYIILGIIILVVCSLYRIKRTQYPDIEDVDIRIEKLLKKAERKRR